MNLSHQNLPNSPTDTSLVSPLNHIPLDCKKALIIVNVQNDSFFVWNDLHVIKNHDFVLPLKELIPYFRIDSDFIWTCWHLDPRSNQLYQEGTEGAEISGKLSDLVDGERDLIVTYSHRSAFQQTSLLVALRKKMITDIYLCGCSTNVSVHSAAADLVHCGFQLYVIGDCLGYREETHHIEAVRQMRDILGAKIINSEEIKKEYMAHVKCLESALDGLHL